MKSHSFSIMIISAIAGLATSCANQTNTVLHDGYTTVEQSKGPTLGYSPASGVELIEKDGLLFKDLDKDGELSPYEDWRLSAEERAKDLATRLSVEEIAGLMLYSSHQPIENEQITEAQRAFLQEDNLRHVLVTKVASPRIAAMWSNNVQAMVEGMGKGIPANNSSDPRNYTQADGEYNAGSGGDISHWPKEIGLGATFDVDLVRKHGEVAAAEYRALGITTALSPQVDIATDPRWRRFYGTFSEDARLNTAIAEAYCDAFQGHDGWGLQSVNAMVKHWPGGGSGEAGRDAHYCFGKYAVYPGGAFSEHIKPFVEGAFRLSGKTRTASAVMPYYTASYTIDNNTPARGNNFSRYIIHDLLREQYGYDGVVCTDWAVTHDNPEVGGHSGKPWGVETLSEAQRHYEALWAGVDQFGGNNALQSVLDAYQIWAEKHGEPSARERFELSAVRLLKNIFRCGLFENPYVDPDKAEQLVGCPEYMTAGYEGQLKSIVMLKNHHHAIAQPAPDAQRKKVYVPQRHYVKVRNFWWYWDLEGEDNWKMPVDRQLLEQYFEVVDSPEQADLCLCFIHSPIADFGYSYEDLQAGGNGYMPITLQYEDYTAEYAREHSIAGGDPKEDFIDRGYKGKTTTTYNKDDMLLVRQMRKEMGNKPVVTIIETERPFVISELEPYTDAILLTFGVTNQAVLDIISGKVEPQALLPFQMPKNMQTVEQQDEDRYGDMDCHVDADGNTYDFAYGLDWNGVINDDRTKRFRR